MQATPTTIQAAVTVEMILDALAPMLSERARAVFARGRTEMSPQLFNFGCVYPTPDTEDTAHANYCDFAERLNYVITQFDGRPHSEIYSKVYVAPNVTSTLTRTHYPTITTSLAPPMMIPLAGDRIYLTAYLFVDGAPAGVHGKSWINTVVGDKIRCALENELPVNPPDLPTPPEPEFPSVREALAMSCTFKM